MDIQKGRNFKWEVGNVESISLPEETYGECTNKSCHIVGNLGNGICQKCWDKGVEGQSKRSEEDIELPIIIIS